MNYYEIYDRYSGELLTRGNAAECRKALGCASLDSFYALANRARRGKRCSLHSRENRQMGIFPFSPLTPPRRPPD